MVIAIDACLGQSSSVGYFFASEGPLTPAQSVGGKLPAVGTTAWRGCERPWAEAVLDSPSDVPIPSHGDGGADSEASRYCLWP